MSAVRETKIFVVSIERKEKASGESLEPIVVASRSYSRSDLTEEVYDLVGDIPIFGVLREINGLGQSMGEVLPDDKYGSIVLDVTRGSFEHDKRIYDIFERHTILHQPITVYSIQKRDGDPAETDDVEIEFRGEVTHIEIDTASSKMTLSVRSEVIPSESPNYQVQRVNFPDADDNASARYLPLVFGVAEVIGYFLQDPTVAVSGGGILDVFRDCRFAWASNFYSSVAAESFVNGAIIAIYTKDKDGEWGALTLPQTTTDDTTAAGLLKVIDTGTPNGRQADTVEIASPFPSVGYMLSINRSDMCLSAAVTACKATFVHELYRKDSGVQVPMDQIIAAGQSAFQLNINPATFQDITVVTYLNDAVFLHPDKAYYFVCRGSDSVVAVGTAVWKRQVLSSRQVRTPRRVDDTANSIRQWRREESDRSDHTYGFYVIGYRNRTQDQQYSFLDVRQYEPALFIDLNTPALGFMTPPDISQKEFIFEVNGLTDNADGDITDTPSAPITRADHVIKFLHYLSNGYSLSGIDFDEFSPGDFCPDINGATEGRKTYREMIVDVLEASASRLAPRRGDDSFALWSYGVLQEPVGIITEGDCRIESITISGEDEILNRVRVQYDRSAIPLTAANQQQQQTNYRATYEDQDDESIELYGPRDLSGDRISLDLLNDEESVARWVDYKLALYGKERMRVQLRVPFWKNDYRRWNLMDIIEVSHTENPSQFGSGSASVEPPMTEDGENVGDDFMMGDLWRRAKRYKMRIMGREPQYNVGTGEATLVFKLLVLDNPEEII